MKEVLILVGSIRREGNSKHIANSLKEIFEGKNLKVTIVNIYDYFGKDIEILSSKINNCQMISFIAPVYVDGFPYPVIDFLYRLEENRKLGKFLEGKRLFFIGQCNFPEARRVKPMINSAKIFTEKLKMKWYGSLAFGGSIMQIEGKELQDAGKVGKKMIKGLNLAVDDILNDKIISTKAEETFKNDINKILFRPIIFLANKFMVKE
ncbi:MAG: NAD(P)H-dependent oxidoreductase [Sarcina sp.]